jgi:nucleoside-diphosphate-sugar epimerase
MPRTYLITGGAGFVGSYLAESLLAQGDRVLVIDNLSTGRLENIQKLLPTRTSISHGRPSPMILLWIA